ncbi:MAG: ribosome maturation factor RimM [Lachnospiraceae bacterium]|nr:ribosome maturation factor RimM [Lachnospiraceae bacterium]
MNEEEYFRIGVITEPHGVRGEVKVYPTTDDPMHLKKVKEFYLLPERRLPEGFVAESVENGDRRMAVLHCLGMKQTKDRIILQFKEIADRDLAEKFRKCELYVDRANAVPLEEDEYYISDLIGLAVYENDEQIGTVKDVLQTGANDVYQILRTDGSELLLPAIRECVLKVDVKGGRMDVAVMEGL